MHRDHIPMLAGGLFAAFFFLYVVSALLGGRNSSPVDAYYDHLARAFLVGRLDLPKVLVNGDLTPYQGRWYLPFAPFPAVLLMPAMLAGGIQAANTVVFSAAVGASACALVFLLLSMGRSSGTPLATRDAALWITVLFGAGSVHWYMSTMGSVWYLAQITGSAALALAMLLAATDRNPWWVGLAMAAALLSRLNLVLALPLLVGIRAGISAAEDAPRRTRAFRLWLLKVAIPIASAGALFLAYNAARFGDPFDFGYRTQNVAPDLATALNTHGQFSLTFLWRNLSVMLFGTPRWVAQCGMFIPDPQGMSLLLTSPALLLLVVASRSGPVARGAWIALVLLLLPILLYYNTGWRQFGYRFSLDFMLPVVILIASTMRGRVQWWAKLLILAGVLVNAYGVAWVNRWLCLAAR